MRAVQIAHAVLRRSAQVKAVTQKLRIRMTAFMLKRAHLSLAGRFENDLFDNFSNFSNESKSMISLLYAKKF